MEEVLHLVAFYIGIYCILLLILQNTMLIVFCWCLAKWHTRHGTDTGIYQEVREGTVNKVSQTLVRYRDWILWSSLNRSYFSTWILLFVKKWHLWHQVVSWRWLGRFLHSEHPQVLKKPYYWPVQTRFRKASTLCRLHAYMAHAALPSSHKEKMFLRLQKGLDLWDVPTEKLCFEVLQLAWQSGRSGLAQRARGADLPRVSPCFSRELRADPPSLSHISIFLFIILLCHLVSWFVQYQLLLCNFVLRCFLRSIIKSHFKKQNKPH